MLLNITSLDCLLMGFAFFLRILPCLLAPSGAGVDHWFWKKYIETYRREKKFPPTIPQYMLDQHQWYPPLFPMLMAKLPHKLFDQFNHLMAIVVDLIRMLLLLLIASWFTDGDLWVIISAGLIYATTPLLISYNFQLNPRGLAALFLDGLLILLLWFYSYNGPWWAWVFVILLSGLILLTHKMTTQLFWFICLCCFLIYHDVRLILLIPFSIVVAFILSKGFYSKVLIAHLDIIKFWQKNWRWIGADVIRESPLYGDKNYQRPGKLHQTGLKGLFWHWFILFGCNPSCWVACLLLLERIFIEPHVLIYSSWLMVWLLIPCFLALLTTFIPILRCIGAGYLYLYNTTLITSLLLAMSFRYTLSPDFSSVIFVVALSFNIFGLILFYAKFFKDKKARIDNGFIKILEKLKQLPVGTVWCIPSVWHEPIAYKTNHSVLWGAHGYGFKLLTPTFPRLMLPIYEIIKNYKINYLLTTDNHITIECIKDLPKSTIFKEENYLLYVFDNGN